MHFVYYKQMNSKPFYFIKSWFLSMFIGPKLASASLMPSQLANDNTINNEEEYIFKIFNTFIQSINSIK